MAMIKTGNRIMITCEGRTVEGEVLLASPNGRSLMLRFEAILLGCVGMMPVFLDDDGKYYSLFGAGPPIEITREQ